MLDVAEHVLAHLDGEQLVLCASVCKTLHSLVESDECSSIWRKRCCEEFGLDEPLPPPRETLVSPCATFRAAWFMWRREFCDFYNTPENVLLLQRAARCWGELKTWLKENAPPIALSLAPGLSCAEMQVLDPDGKLPVSARAIYRIHNGQLPEAAPLVIDSEEARENIWNGLFGGYKFYEHIVNMRMPQLAQGIQIGDRRNRNFKWSADAGSIERAGGAGGAAEKPDFPVAFAVSLKQMGRVEKTYMLHNGTGHIYVNRKDRTMFCCNSTPKPAGAGVAALSDSRDGVLVWLEAYARSLARRNFVIAPFGTEVLPWGSHMVGINLYPCDTPMSNISVTRNIRIHASGMYVPELSTQSEHFFSYCMRMSLEGAGPEGSGGEAQLLSRHLVFSDGPNSEPTIVDGEAVIGEYPHLLQGGGFEGGVDYLYAGKKHVTEYTYCSCTHITTSRGSVMGSFKFVPGCIERPKGPPFDVSIPYIELVVPDFV